MTKKPKEILSQRNSQQQQQRREEEPASPAEPKRSEDENGGESSVHNPNIESLPSLRLRILLLGYHPDPVTESVLGQLQH